MVCPNKSRNSFQNNILHSVFTVTALMRVNAAYSEKPQTTTIFMEKLVPNN